MANISIGNPYVYHQYIRRVDGKRNYGAFLMVELLSQDQVLNTSTARLSYLLGYPGSGAMWLDYKNTGPTIQLGYNPNGTVYSYNTAKTVVNFYATGSNSDVNKATVLATWTVVIKHNSSGEGYLQAEYRWDNRSTDGYMPVDSTGFTEIINLPTINSATKISVSPAILESGNETITATAFNDTNLTTVEWSLDNSTWTTLVTQQPATGGVLTVPPIAYNTLKPLIGTKTTATVYVRAQTWLADGTTRVGSDQLAQFTVQTGVIPQSWYDDLNGGVGVTFGKKATGEGFVIADAINPWDCEVNGKPWINFVTEEHRETNTGWEDADGEMESRCWRVWYDKTFEMWGAVDVAGDGLSIGVNSVEITYPYTLASIPTVQLTPFLGSVNAIPGIVSKNATGKGITTNHFYIQNHRNSSTVNTITYYIRGKVA